MEENKNQQREPQKPSQEAKIKAYRTLMGMVEEAKLREKLLLEAEELTKQKPEMKTILSKLNNQK